MRYGDASRYSHPALTSKALGIVRAAAGIFSVDNLQLWTNVRILPCNNKLASLTVKFFTREKRSRQFAAHFLS